MRSGSSVSERERLRHVIVNSCPWHHVNPSCLPVAAFPRHLSSSLLITPILSSHPRQWSPSLPIPHCLKSLARLTHPLSVPPRSSGQANKPDLASTLALRVTREADMVSDAMQAASSGLSTLAAQGTSSLYGMARGLSTSVSQWQGQLSK